MSKFEESNFYKALQDFFINADKKTFLQFLAEFYNRTEGIIDKNNIQDDLIKELRELYLEFNEKGIDENIVREKVNYFLENSLKIKDINLKLEQKANKVFLTPEEFGAIGDGVADDSEAITLCFAKAKELNLNIKFLPDKTYIINDSIIIDFSTVIDCSNSLIKTKSADDEKYLFDIYNANDVVIKNIKVCSSIDKTPYLDVRNHTTTEALASNVYAIYVRYSENVIIENVILDSITGLGGHNSKNVTIKNYCGANLEMPVYFGNIDKMNIDGFHINFNNTGLSGYYHGFYLNHNISNAKIENGEIENIYNPIISDCFNFLTSAGAVEGDNIKDIKVNNVKCKGNFKQLTRLGECSTAYFDNIIFNSDTCENLVEHCKGVINQRCEFSNSKFTCGNIGADDRGLVKEGYSYEVDFSTKFFNCDFYIKTSTGFNTIMKPRVNVELDYCRLIIDGDFKEFNCFNASANLISKYIIKNCKIKIVGDKKTVVGVGNFSLENTTLKIINTEIDGNCSGGYACYNTGGILINNTFYKARNIISSDSRCITNNNFIVETIN